MNDIILNELRTPVFLININNVVIYVNPIGEEFLGVSSNIIIGQSINSFIPDNSTIFNLLNRVRKSKSSLTEESLDFSNIKFPNRKVRLHLVPLSSDTEQIIIQIGELALSEILQSQRINSKISKSFSSMVDMLMHELKNPLAGIKGASQLIKSDLKNNPNLLELANLITVESNRIEALLNRMEHITNNNHQLECDFYNIHEILNHCRRVSENSFGLNLNFVDEYDPSLPDFWINKDLLIQILLNLLKNASEASFKNGKIKIKTSFNTNKIKSFQQNNIPTTLPLQIEIIDHGSGIPPNILPNIFDPFVSSKKNGKGLGLSIVASGLEEMGAVINVLSNHGTTTFCINFPLKNKY